VTIAVVVNSGTRPSGPALRPVPTIDVPTTTVTTTTVTTTTVTTDVTKLPLGTVLTSHRWLIEPHFWNPGEHENQTIEFAHNGATVTVFDGCRTSTIAVTLTGHELHVIRGGQPTTCEGNPIDNPFTAGGTSAAQAVSVSQSGGVVYLDLLSDNSHHTYIAQDTLPLPTASDLQRAWRLPEGGALRLESDGSFGVNYCTRLGTWSWTASRLQLVGFDSHLAVTCAGTTAAPTLDLLRRTPVAVALWNNNLVLTDGRSVGYVMGSTTDEAAFDPKFDALDIDAGAVFGFALGTEVSDSFVVGVVDEARGRHTFDSGWYELPSSYPTLLARLCAGKARIVRWGDFTLGFIDTSGHVRLWAWAVGNDPAAVAERFGYAGIFPPATASGLQSRPPQLIWLGASLAEVRSAKDPYVMQQITLTDANGKPTTSDTSATRGTVTVGRSTIELRLAEGRITWMSGATEGSCR
jgi:hypothetical protein